MRITAHEKIQRAMRQNEVDLLFHIRTTRVSYLDLFSMAWHNALNRLEKAGMVRFSRKNRQYVARFGARPVTPVVRKRTKSEYDRELRREERRGYPKGFK
jgi:hypothetical protein